jgi:hypothetical protein
MKTRTAAFLTAFLFSLPASLLAEGIVESAPVREAPTPWAAIVLTAVFAAATAATAFKKNSGRNSRK